MRERTPPREAPWWVFAGRAVLLRADWLDDRKRGPDGDDRRVHAPLDEPDDPRPRAPLSDGGATRFLQATVPEGSGLVAPSAEPDAASEPAQTLVAGDVPDPPAGYRWVDLRLAAGAMDPDLFRRAGRAWQLLEWRRTHRFCGVCGRPTAPGPYDALACTVCDHLHFPRLSPAVIVLVHDGDRVLLGRSGHLPEGMYSTLAGFVEPGESLEETVYREILEEADVQVDDLRYFGSQPWPFPHSLMVGFFARWAGGTPRPADGELESVEWFHRDALPRIPGPVSIARSLIEAWRRGDAG